MVDLSELQKEVYDNKVKHGFNTTNIAEEFCLALTELAEAYKALSLTDKNELAEELADVIIYLLGIAEMQGVQIEPALVAKIEKNRRRRYYRREDGSWAKTEDNEPI